MSEPLDETQIHTALEKLIGWVHEGDTLKKTFRLASFPQAIEFISRLAVDAEAMGHHPELRNVYSTVDVSLRTHDAGNKVTQKDVELARAIERARAGL